MSNYLNQVEEFHKTFKAPVLPSPQLAPEDRAKLRVSLLQEELKELQEAIEKGDLVEVADAFCDLQYVLSEAVLEFGMKEVFNRMFNEVHRSNMSKACSTEEEAFDTIKHYMANGTECTWIQDGEKYLVLRSSDQKVLKSINYSPANLKEFLYAECPECTVKCSQEELNMFGGICENCNEEYGI